MNTEIKFEEIAKMPKTSVYSVISNHDNLELGRIRWHGAWRQYIFSSFEGSVWSADCLAEVSEFLVKLKKKRRMKK